MDEMNLPPFVSNQYQQSMEDKRVGFGRRLGAKLLDSLVVIILGVLLFYSIGDTTHGELDRWLRISMVESGQDVESVGGATMDWLFSFVKLGLIMSVVGTIVSVLELVVGASPGKMLVSIRIAHADGRAGTIALWAKRWVLVNVSSLLSLVGTLTGVAILSTVSSVLSIIFFFGCFMVLSPARQALHDVIAKTAVYFDEDVIR